MNSEQLSKGNELIKNIANLTGRIKNTSKCFAEDIAIDRYQLLAGSFGTSYDNHTQDSQIPQALKEEIRNEIIVCAERIKRLYDKEIKKLQKEFDSL